MKVVLDVSEPKYMSVCVTLGHARGKQLLGVLASAITAPGATLEKSPFCPLCFFHGSQLQ